MLCSSGLPSALTREIGLSEPFEFSMTASRTLPTPGPSADPSVATVFRRPVTAWYAEWKAQKQSAPPTAEPGGAKTSLFDSETGPDRESPAHAG